MRWQGRRESANVEDRRGMRMPGGKVGGLGCGGLILVIVIALLTGTDPQQLLDAIGGGGGMVSTEPSLPGGEGSAPGDELGRFASVVLGDTEETWNAVFAAEGQRYREPKLILFSGSTPTACGYGNAAVGPFYCPADERVYIDLSFFHDLERRFGAPGDFAQAYVIAHEIGHHVQNLLGITERVQRQQQRLDQEDANGLSVRLELQADCLAGVWAHHAHRERRLLEPGDVEEGLGAAAAIGDDRLQRQATGTVAPESWTHGSSEQRVRWLRQGLQTGDPNACDTFDGRL